MDTRLLGIGDSVEERFEGLTPEAERLLRDAGRLLVAGRVDEAERALTGVLALAPDHVEALRLMATVHSKHGRVREAFALLMRARALKPDDALVLHHLGATLMQLDRLDQALPLLQRACELAPKLVSAWFNLGTAFDKLDRFEEAEAAFRRATEVDPKHVAAHVAHGTTLRAVGRMADAVAEFRHALTLDPESVSAWAALNDFKIEPFSVDDTEALKRLREKPQLSARSRAIVGFAYAKALEDQGRYADALTELHAANSAWKTLETKWDGADFAGFVERVMDAFTPLPARATDPTLGKDIIFIVSLPRSGSTLTEQILSAHSQVEGGGERTGFTQVLAEESRRRRVEFPRWIPEATPDDWTRMGRRYIELTQNHRSTKPRSTDKALSNWLRLGVAHSMLPGARFVNSRRDPLETAFAIYRHLFNVSQSYAYSYEDIAACWRLYDRLMLFWHARYPGSIYDHVYEDLIADPETQVRRLLEFCDLPFERACLRFHENRRGISTSSAAQVRQPLRADTAKAPLYGDLLAPLRRSLGL